VQGTNATVGGRSGMSGISPGNYGMIADLFNESVSFGLEAKLELVESQLVVE